MMGRKLFQGLIRLLVVVAMAGAFACSSTGSRSGTPPPNPVAQPSGAVSTGAGGTASTSPRPLFYDFPDIPVPRELDLQAGDSYVVQSGTTKTGLLTLRGRVDLNSVVSFFQLAMPREGWKARGNFNYQRSILIFEKRDRICVIRLHEGMVYTTVEIFVTPAGN